MKITFFEYNPSHAFVEGSTTFFFYSKSMNDWKGQAGINRNWFFSNFLTDAVKLIGKVTNLFVRNHIHKTCKDKFGIDFMNTITSLNGSVKSPALIFRELFLMSFDIFSAKFKGIPRAQMLQIACSSYLRNFLSLARCCKNYVNAATFFPKKTR